MLAAGSCHYILPHENARKQGILVRAQRRSQDPVPKPWSISAHLVVLLAQGWAKEYANP